MQTGTPAPPALWTESEEAARAWWARLAESERSLLICDYDGTLAPFQEDKMQARPYPGVEERLEALAAIPGATVALVSGRPVSELITLMPLAARLELFGSHGREHRGADGSYHLAEPLPEVRTALDDAEQALRAAGWSREVERKSGSLAVHWRALSPDGTQALERDAKASFEPHLTNSHLSVLGFDGGLELRSTDWTKAHAVEQLLESSGAEAVAYLGDDLTDEDAFRALGERGLSLLVREAARPTLAPFLLRPPGELIGFLDRWTEATRGEALSAATPTLKRQG